MTHGEIIARAEHWLLRSKRCGFILRELRSVSDSGEIPDIIGWKYGQSHLIECKVSRSDFFQDSRKIFRRRDTMGMGSYRYYAVPAGLVERNDVPVRWGLLYVYEKQVRLIKQPMYIADTAEQELPILISALRRVHIRSDLEKIYNPLTIKRRRRRK